MARFGAKIRIKVNKKTHTKSRVSYRTASFIVIANMIGAGVFTSLGFQIGGGIESVFPLLMLWLVGGVIALCGALCYGELAAMMPRSGGEYHYLSEIYHPAVGFLSGWVSMTVGFAAPVALAAVALGKYTQSVFPSIDATILAVVVVLLLTFIHAYDIKAGSIFQNISTTVKLGLIIFFILCGIFLIDTPQPIQVLPLTGDISLIFSSSFAVSLVYVSYAYSGWNASAYLAGEIDNPKRNVPRSLFLGTLVVMVCYILLNFVFLYTVPMGDLKNQLEVGYISANAIFGLYFGGLMGMMIALLLVSSISSMIFAGPRVTQVMGEDIPLLNFLSKKNAKGLPVIAILWQAVISIILILSSSFESILQYVGFTLNLFTFMTVLGVIVLRIQKPQVERPYRAWAYPITPLIFLALTAWTIYFLLIDKPVQSLAGLATVLIGLIVYFLDQSTNKKTEG